MRRLGRLRSYARPSELLRAKACSLVRPAGGVTKVWSLLLSPEEERISSKTGDFDVSVLLDSPWLQAWADELFSSLKACHPTSPLWDFSCQEYAEIFKEIANKFKVNATPYQTRHSGPSIDRARDHRSLLEIQQSGQWKAHKSVVRYEKSARLARSWEALDSNFRAQAQWCEQGNPAGAPNGPRFHRNRDLKRRYVMDLFSGEGGVSRAIRRLGFRSKFWDIKHGMQHDDRPQSG